MSDADWDLARAFLDSDPWHAAMALEKADVETIAAVLSRCPSSILVGVLRHLEPVAAREVLERLSLEARTEALGELSPRAAASILRTLEVAERQRWLAPLPRPVARSLRVSLDFPAATAGSLMDGDFLALPAAATAGEARNHIRRRKGRAGNYLYVVDESDRVLGVLSIGDLILATSAATIATQMRTSVEVLRSRASIEAILAHPGWHELHSLPVVDNSGALVGVLRRESYEQLRRATAERAHTASSSVGLGIAELLWTWTAVALEELSGAVRVGGQVRGRQQNDND